MVTGTAMVMAMATITAKVTAGGGVGNDTAIAGTATYMAVMVANS